MEDALEAAALHPARLLGISHRKGSLHYGADAGPFLPLDSSGGSGVALTMFVSVTDLVLLDDGLRVRTTYISGEEVWRAEL